MGYEKTMTGKKRLRIAKVSSGFLGNQEDRREEETAGESWARYSRYCKRITNNRIRTLSFWIALETVIR